MGFNNELIKLNIPLTHGSDWEKRTNTSNNKRKYYFKNTVFEKRVFLEHTATACSFENCYFKGGVIFSSPPIPASAFINKIYSCRVRFIDCKVEKKLVITDCIFEKKVRFHESEIEKFIPSNAIFKDLADFWSTKFLKTVIFYKTDFNATAVFSMATFEENVLFTYSLFAEKTIFSRTHFKKGIDLSQAIISGDLKFFDLELSNFKSPYFHKDNKRYQKAITHQGFIPLVNKQETFRLLKHYSNINGDGIATSRYKVFEYRSYNALIWSEMRLGHRWVSNLVNIPMMFLNRITNNYGSNYWLGVAFTISVAAIFLNLMLKVSGDYTYTLDYTKCEWSDFVTILNPVHKIKELSIPLTKRIYLLDFLSRIAIGYGIYQTVQAFRKFK
jgi:hypothetical protein